MGRQVGKSFQKSSNHTSTEVIYQAKHNKASLGYKRISTYAQLCDITYRLT